MDKKKLRQKVLDLAIHGKLVKQDPNDEPASILLDRIRAEKARLAKEGKIKKTDLIEKPISEDEIPFEVPEGWEWIRLGSVCNITSSKRVFEKDYVPNGIPFYRSKEIGDLYRKETIKTELYITNEHYEEIKKKYGVPEQGDILITSVGTIGNTWICDGRKFYYKDGNITQICKSFVFFERYVDSFLHSLLFESQVKDKVSGTAYNALTIIKLNNMILPLPPLAEQHRIVKAVDELFEQIDIIEQSEKELEEAANKTRDKLLNLAIQGHLVPQDPNEEPASILLERIRAEKARLVKEGKLKKKDLEEKPISPDEIPFDIPEGWVWCRIGDVALIARGGSPRPIKAFLTDDLNGINWIKIGDTDKGGKYINSCKEKIKPEGLKHSRLVKPGDFLLTNSMSFGRPYITNIEGCIHDGWLMISPYADTFDQSFLYYVLSSELASNQFYHMASGAVVQNLNSDKVSELLLPLPPLSEQRRIVTKLEELLHEIDKLKG